jgi:hypothetical protein
MYVVSIKNTFFEICVMYTISLFLHDVGTEIIATLRPMIGAIPKQ